MTSPMYDDDAFRDADQIATESDAITDLIRDVRDRLADVEALHLLGDDEAADEVWAEIWTYLMARRRQAAHGLVRLLEPAAKELAAKGKAAGEAAIEEVLASIAEKPEPVCPDPWEHDRELRRGESFWRRRKAKTNEVPTHCGWCGKKIPKGAIAR